MNRTLVVIAISLCASSAMAQIPATGFPPFGSFENGRFDAINRQNLNVNFAIPVFSVPARGMGLSHAIYNNGLLWNRQLIGATLYWMPSNISDWGWNKDSVVGRTNFTSASVNCVTYGPHGDPIDHWRTNYFGYVYVDPAGTRHTFGLDFESATIGDCSNGPRTGYALDGSGYYIDATTATAPMVFATDGTKIEYALKLTDTNGNYVNPIIVSSTETDWKDSVGRTALKIIQRSGSSCIDLSQVTHTSCTDYKYTAPDGSEKTITLYSDSLSIKTNFACSGIVEYNGSATLPFRIDFPNNLSYAFSYEGTPNFSGYYTGRVKRITLPTGGYYEYSYTGSNNGVNCSDGSVVSMTRVISAGEQTPPQWTYARTQVGSDWKTTVTSPQLSYDSAANVTTYLFNASGQLTTKKHYQGAAAGTPLRTLTTSWATNGTPSSTTTILEDNSTQTKTDTTFDDYGNLTQSIEYAWGAATPVRTTQLTYLASSSYTARNIRNRPTQVLVRDGGTSGTIKSRTDITYDDSGYINTICPTGVAQHDDTNYGCSFTVRGLPTSATTYATASTPSGGVTRHLFYDFFGNLTKTDVSGTQQQLWTYSSATTFALPDSVTIGPSAPQLSTSAIYNSYTGLVASSTDANSKTTSYSYDTMKRLTDVQRSDTQHTYYTYSESPLWMKTDSPVDSSQRVKKKTDFDSLGRPIKETVTDTSGTSYSIVDTQYDTLSRPFRVSNPHNGTAQYWTETRIDAIGRVVATHLVDSSWAVQTGNSTTYSYSLKTATVTDPASKARKSESDALGRMVKVFEPDVANPTQLTKETWYTYNVLNLPTLVSYPSPDNVQSRTFVYDDMGRVTQQATPEAGAWNYTNNEFNQVATRTDARGVVTTYAYDTLHRPYTISYNVSCCTSTVPATNTITYTFGTSSASNNNGRLILVTNNTISDAFAYDSLGRATQDDRVINSTTYTTQYAYNFASELTQITYPSGRVVKQDFDAIGRLSKLYKDTTTTYADTFGYNAAGQLTGFNYGNGVAASFGYAADRLHLTSLAYNKSSQDLLALSYYYKTDSTNCPNAPSGNNGQIQCIKDNSNTTLTPGAGGRSVTYTYDPLIRLSTGVTTGSTQYPAWGLSWTYDRYGNRTAQSIASGCTGLTCPTNSVTVSSTTNRITDSGAQYDANGNMTNDGLNSLGYDAENHMVSGASWAYAVDGGGLRVRRCTPNCTSPTSNTVYVFEGSSVIAEYDNGAAVGSPTREYIYLGGQLVAKFDASTTTYFHQDLLSNRFTTNSSGTMLSQFGHFPFGESWFTGTTEKWRFTTYERDNASGDTGNDYSIMRSYVNRFGRFSSSDPIGGNIWNPQSLNRFTYVHNDPINFMDPLGLQERKRDRDPNAYGKGDGFRFSFWPFAFSITRTFELLSLAFTPTSYYCPNASSIGCDPNELIPIYGNWGLAVYALSGRFRPQEVSRTNIFLKEFFKLSGGPGDVPTCAQQAVLRIVGEFVPFMPTETTVIQATAPAAQAMAFNSAVAETDAAIEAHIAVRGLTVPLRSSIVRNLATQGAEKAVAVGARANLAVQTLAVDYAAVKSTYLTSIEARNGACAAAVPIF